jgi:hypothetical protein
MEAIAAVDIPLLENVAAHRCAFCGVEFRHDLDAGRTCLPVVLGRERDQLVVIGALTSANGGQARRQVCAIQP